MNPQTHDVAELTVDDVMSREVVSVQRTETIDSAARALCKSGVTGAPVVDNAGKVIGVISAADFVRCAAEDPDHRPVTEQLVRDTPTGPYRVRQVRQDTVAQHMSPYAQTVPRRTSLCEASRQMCLEGLHRLIVIDDRGRPAGVLSPLDVLAAWTGVPCQACRES